jgi:NTP pyrophosphatase (non-canonical NTP hydrolase)
MHDEGWAVRRSAKNLDDWLGEEMYEVAEAAYVDQIEGANADYIDRLRFAVALAGEDALDDDVRELLASRESD